MDRYSRALICSCVLVSAGVLSGVARAEVIEPSLTSDPVAVEQPVQPAPIRPLAVPTPRPAPHQIAVNRVVPGHAAVIAERAAITAVPRLVSCGGFFCGQYAIVGIGFGF
jgi:hypothetical protein